MPRAPSCRCPPCRGAAPHPACSNSGPVPFFRAGTSAEAIPAAFAGLSQCQQPPGYQLSPASRLPHSVGDPRLAPLQRPRCRSWRRLRRLPQRLRQQRKRRRHSTSMRGLGKAQGQAPPQAAAPRGRHLGRPQRGGHCRLRSRLALLRRAGLQHRCCPGSRAQERRPPARLGWRRR